MYLQLSDQHFVWFQIYRVYIFGHMDWWGIVHVFKLKTNQFQQAVVDTENDCGGCCCFLSEAVHKKKIWDHKKTIDGMVKPSETGCFRVYFLPIKWVNLSAWWTQHLAYLSCTGVCSRGRGPARGSRTCPSSSQALPHSSYSGCTPCTPTHRAGVSELKIHFMAITHPSYKHLVD